MILNNNWYRLIMINKKQYSNFGFFLNLLFLLSISPLSTAQPVIVEGIVPNDASKQALLNRLSSIYGKDQVIDKIQVRAISTPNGWDESIHKLITPDLKKITQGKLDIYGTSATLSGKLHHQNDIATTSSLFQSFVTAPYRLSTTFTANSTEQKVVDDALKNRIIEFESGSSILTLTGTKILDEMVIALNKVQGKNIKIIGHTDNLGDAQKNIKLSIERAEAVKKYLVDKNISANRLTTTGLGSEKPIADNNNPSGRKRNRRIEFEVF